MSVCTQGGICILKEPSTTWGPRRYITGGLTRHSLEQQDSFLAIHTNLPSRPFACQWLAPIRRKLSPWCLEVLIIGYNKQEFHIYSKAQT